VQRGRGPGVFASLRLCEVVDLEVYRVEPYVACQFIPGPESDRPGEGSHSWATGTTAWTLSVVWEWMPGVRPELERGRIDPYLPSGWTGARLTRCTVDFLAVERLCVGKREGFLGGLRGAVWRKVSCLLLLASYTLLDVQKLVHRSTLCYALRLEEMVSIMSRL